MDEGRLAAVKKSLDFNRKFVYVMNDIAKNRQEIYDSCLSQEMHESRSRLVANLQMQKRALVRNRILLRCLRGGRENEQDNPYGAYNGRPLRAFTREIEQTLAWNNPRLRRLRKVEQIKESCLKHGAILDPVTVRHRMDEFFAKNKEKEEAKLRRKAKLQREEAKKAEQAAKKQANPLSASGITLNINPWGRLMGIQRQQRQQEKLQDNEENDDNNDENTDNDIQDTSQPLESIVEKVIDMHRRASITKHEKNILESSSLHHGGDVLSKHSLLPPIPQKDSCHNDEEKIQSSSSPLNNNSTRQSTKSKPRPQVKSSVQQPISQNGSDSNTIRQKLKMTHGPKDTQQENKNVGKILDSQIDSNSESLSKGSLHRSNSKSLSTLSKQNLNIEKEKSTLKRAPTLILPPIQSKKSDVKASKMTS